MVASRLDPQQHTHVSTFVAIVPIYSCILKISSGLPISESCISTSQLGKMWSFQVLLEYNSHHIHLVWSTEQEQWRLQSSNMLKATDLLSLHYSMMVLRQSAEQMIFLRFQSRVLLTEASILLNACVTSASSCLWHAQSIASIETCPASNS